MKRKTREELISDAKALGMDLNYMPKVVIPNIFEIGEEEWQKSMKEGIGSSSASAAIGKSPYKTAAEVALEKAYGKSKSIAENDPDKQYMLDSGHMQETAILKWYAASLGYAIALKDPRNPSTSEIKDVTEITPSEWESYKGKGVVCVDHARYAHPLYPFIFSDMDGVVFTPDREMYVAECKTNGADSKDFKWNWKSGVFGEGPASVGNLGYIDQARQHMAVSNTDRCDIIAVNGFNAANNVVVTVYRDMEEEKKLIESEKKLWDMVLEGSIPSFTMLSERSLENITYILTPEEKEQTPMTFPERNRSVLSEFFSLEAEIAEKENEIKGKEERLNALKVELLKEMGGNVLAVMPGFTEGKEIRLEIKCRETNTFDSKRFKLEHPEMALDYCKCTIGDPKLSVKEVKIKEKKGA